MSWFDYTGKPHTRLIIPAGRYKALDVRTKVPPRKGIELHMAYVNTTIVWKDTASGLRHGRIRMRYRRDDGDYTGYHDWQIVDGPGTDEFLCQPIHWESGSGIGGTWQIKCVGDIAHLTLSTRYAKIAVLS